MKGVSNEHNSRDSLEDPEDVAVRYYLPYHRIETINYDTLAPYVVHWGACT